MSMIRALANILKERSKIPEEALWVLGRGFGIWLAVEAYSSSSFLDSISPCQLENLAEQGV